MAGPDAFKLDFVTLDVFTDTRFLGNPLAVVFVPAALRERLDQGTKQRIAREFNLSETVFLHTLDSEPTTAVTTREIDIFTPEEELPFAGHPTIGSAYLVLHHLGWSHIDALLTKSGPIPIQALPGNRRGVRAAIPHAVHIHQQTLGGILESGAAAGPVAASIKNGLSEDPEIRAAELVAPVVSIVRGMTFVLVRLPSLEHLARAAPVKRLDFAGIPALLDQGEWHKSFVSRYYYVPLAESVASDGSQSVTMQTRMVELSFEDPATGSAACTLASYLTIKGKADRGAHFDIAQGVEMGRRSEITVDAVADVEDGQEVKIKELYLGGTAVVVMGGSISVL
ncbi:Diaminopimelate epimerase-like protein [Madurella fahalii]|uniref:Diaminopimelate epimerase-like protein n=1 Tax=Madurella fahalii TaxID=1157608 RepID=A0ABQ0GTF0_9PEZI